MVYTEKILGQILQTMYKSAPEKDKAAMIHLFGIKYADVIRKYDLKNSQIILHSGLPTSYVAELNKGIRLAQYVQIILGKDTF